MPLTQDQQTRTGGLIAALAVLFAIGAEEAFGTVPDVLFGDLSRLTTYGIALVITPFMGAVFARVPDELELKDHLLHGGVAVVVLAGLSAFFLFGGFGKEVKALFFDLGLVGATIGWAFHVFQDQFL